jgi:hypothetical protein
MKQRNKSQSAPRAGVLEAIAKLDMQFSGVLDDARRLDRTRGAFGANRPYEDFKPKVQRLVEDCRQVFQSGDQKLARKAYEALFALFAKKDSYGFGIVRPSSDAIRQDYIDYLRAVIGTAPAEEAGARLLKAWRQLRSAVWDAARHLKKVAATGRTTRGAWSCRCCWRGRLGGQIRHRSPMSRRCSTIS